MPKPKGHCGQRQQSRPQESEQADKPQYAELLQALSAQLKGKPKGHLTYVLYVLAKRYVPEQRYAALRAGLKDLNRTISGVSA